MREELHFFLAELFSVIVSGKIRCLRIFVIELNHNDLVL